MSRNSLLEAGAKSEGEGRGLVLYIKSKYLWGGRALINGAMNGAMLALY